MALFNRKTNQPVRLAAADPIETPAEGVLFTTEQFDTMVAALKLDPEANPDTVVAAVAALAEQPATEQVAAAGTQGVTIDQHAWRDMKRAVQRGLTVEQQEHRLAAEQTVDQAIRLGKASPTARESWIAAYQADPETTVHRLNRAQEIPRMEIGYGIQPTEDGDKPKGWVR